MNDMSNLANAASQSLSGSRLENKSVILTGAAGSIGRYISRQLLREGAKVTMTGRDQTKLDGFVEELSEEGFDAANITTIVGDCADPRCLSRDCRARRWHLWQARCLGQQRRAQPVPNIRCGIFPLLTLRCARLSRTRPCSIRP